MNLNDCNKDCLNCIKKYKKKHRLTAGTKNPFKIACQGIPLEYIPKDLQNILPKEQVKTALSMLDPVVWANENLDWHCFDSDGKIWKRKNPEEYHKWVRDHPEESIYGHSRYHRPYQDSMISCSSQYKVFRLGRRCLEKGTLIATPKGPIPIEDLKIGDEVYGWKKDETKYGKTEITKVKNTFNNGIQEVTALYHGGNKYLSCTSNHEWLTTSSAYNKEIKCRTLSEFSRDEAIVRKFFLPHMGDINEPNAYVLGALLGDGCSRSDTSYSVYISSATKEVPQKVAKCLGLNFYKCHVKNYTWRISKNDYRTKIDIPYYEKWIKGKYSYEKWVDLEVVKTWNLESCLQFLAGFLDSDGKVNLSRDGKRLCIGWGCQSKSAIEVVQYLLLAIFQFRGSILIDNRDRYKNGPIYHVNSTNNLFSKRILKILDPYIVKESRKWKEKYESCLENNTNSNFFGVRQKEKYLIEVYDIEVDNESHLYLTANGLVTHNSGKTEALVISILFHLFTKPGVSENDGFKVIVIAPYQNQVNIISDRIEELLFANPATSNAVKSKVKSPIYRLELHNKSTLKCFTAGTKSGGNAESIRGSDAHMIVFDEADYLATADMDSALSVIIDHPDAKAWMSSTPKGTRDKFYENCHDTMWKEFFFPSMVNPMWGPQTEAFFKRNLTEIGYKHEILAEFGEQEEGVFQNMYVDAARANYEYGMMVRDLNWTYFFGVDWNDVKIGTNILVVGFDPVNLCFFVVDRQVVSRDGWTQLAACQKIAEMNGFWRPEFIYVDAGFGGTQIEVLRDYGWRSLRDPGKGPTHSDSRLRNIIKSYNFGGKIEIFDLVTKQPIPKPAKSFLVENTVRRFETNTIFFPESDKMLEKQLLGYVVDHVTVAGVPIYKPGNEKVGDHALDALMLALVGFTLEKTDFGKPKVNSDFTFCGKFGERITPNFPGGLVFTKEKREDPKEQQRPSMKRTVEVSSEDKVLLTQRKLPASNINEDRAEPKLWDWPGFDHDAPKPKFRSSEVRGLPRVSRPMRKNI